MILEFDGKKAFREAVRRVACPYLVSQHCNLWSDRVTSVDHAESVAMSEFFQKTCAWPILSNGQQTAHIPNEDNDMHRFLISSVLRNTSTM